MATIDDKVADWLLEKFLWSRQYDKAKHGSIKNIRVLSVDTGWECGCYSEWTRDDSYVLTGRFTGDKGEFIWSYGYWADLPSFIRELDDYINGNDCPYDEDDEDE